MEHTIPALVIAAILIVGGVVIADVTNSSVDSVNQSWRQMEALSEERLGTVLSVVSTSVTNGGADITIVLSNEGRTTLRDPSLMDVIVNYEGTDNQRYARWIPYTSGPLQDNTWTVTGISNDFRNPSDFDPGEEMTIQIRINPATTSNPERWVVIATETGVTYSIYF